jgi:hypothetical protein
MIMEISTEKVYCIKLDKQSLLNLKMDLERHELQNVSSKALKKEIQELLA